MFLPAEIDMKNDMWCLQSEDDVFEERDYYAYTSSAPNPKWIFMLGDAADTSLRVRISDSFCASSDRYYMFVRRRV